MSQGTMLEHIGIEITELGDNYLIGKMPVDHRTVQPARILHGGASVTLAESLGSIGAYLSVDRDKYYTVGLEINANHVRPGTSGFVYGKASPIHQGRTTQIWEIRITNEEDKLVCISRITMAVVKKERVL